jgi:hypothetical protein
MHVTQWTRGTLALLTAVFLTIGCAQSGDKEQAKKNPDKAGNADKGNHDGWWCDEHGVPEAECSMCMSAAKAKKLFKDKGDWCAEHNRAKSQCFICDPSLREKYAAVYRAKTGKEPPEPTDNMPGKGEKKGGDNK